MSESNWIKKKKDLGELVGKYILLSDSFTIERRGGSTKSRNICASFKQLGLKSNVLYPLVAITQSDTKQHFVQLGIETDGIKRLIEYPWSEHCFESDPSNNKVPDLSEWQALLPAIAEEITAQAPTPSLRKPPQSPTPKPSPKPAVGMILSTPQTANEVREKLPHVSVIEINGLMHPGGTRGRRANLYNRSFPIVAVTDDTVIIKNISGKTYDLPTWLCEAFDVKAVTPKNKKTAPEKPALKRKKSAFEEPAPKLLFLPEFVESIHSLAKLREFKGKLVVVRPVSYIRRDYTAEPQIKLTRIFGPYEGTVAWVAEVDDTQVGNECGLVFPTLGVETRLPFYPHVFIPFNQAQLQQASLKQLGAILSCLNLRHGESIRIKTPNDGNWIIIRDGGRVVSV